MLDITGSLRELGQHLAVDSIDLGDPVLRLVPGDAEAAGQLRSEVGVIQGRQGALVDLDGASIESQPPTIGRPNPVGDHGVGVELRVELAAGLLTEQRNHNPLGIHAHHMAAVTHPRVGVGFDPAEHRVDRSVVGLDDLVPRLLVADSEQHRHRLGRRESSVVATN